MAKKRRTRTRRRSHGRLRRSTARTRRLRIPTPDGVRTVTIRTSRGASAVGRYWNAVHKYLAQGDKNALRPFVGKSFIDARGKRVKFLTDRAALDELGGAGVLSFETIYAKVV